MKKYRVNVNGAVYEIEIEEIDGGAAAARPAVPAPARTPRPAAPKRAAVSAPAAPKQAAAPVPAAPAPASSAAPAAGAANGATVNSPMPGNILKVLVENGQSVKKGEILMILEAMKMENEIMAPCDGVVANVSVTAGVAVNSGALLCSIQ